MGPYVRCTYESNSCKNVKKIAKQNENMTIGLKQNFEWKYTIHITHNILLRYGKSGCDS